MRRGPKVTDLGYPITIEPTKLLGCSYDMIPVANYEPIKLNEQESRLFRRFMSQNSGRSLWIEEVGQLQCTYDINNIDYLTCAFPLAGFKLALSTSPSQLEHCPKVTQELVQELKIKISTWNIAMVDMVQIDGVDLRKFRCPQCGGELSDAVADSQDDSTMSFCTNCGFLKQK